MITTTQQENGITIVELTGNIIGEVIPELRQEMITHIDKNETPRILVNLKGVHKMDSSGLGTLANVYNLARAKNGRIGIINVGRNISSLLVKSRLINIFEHYKTKNAALSSLARRF